MCPIGGTEEVLRDRGHTEVQMSGQTKSGSNDVQSFLKDVGNRVERVGKSGVDVSKAQRLLLEASGVAEKRPGTAFFLGHQAQTENDKAEALANLTKVETLVTENPGIPSAATATTTIAAARKVLNSAAPESKDREEAKRLRRAHADTIKTLNIQIRQNLLTKVTAEVRDATAITEVGDEILQLTERLRRVLANDQKLATKFGTQFQALTGPVANDNDLGALRRRWHELDGLDTAIGLAESGISLTLTSPLNFRDEGRHEYRGNNRGRNRHAA